MFTLKNVFKGYVDYKMATRWANWVAENYEDVEDDRETASMYLMLTSVMGLIAICGVNAAIDKLW